VDGRGRGNRGLHAGRTLGVLAVDEDVDVTPDLAALVPDAGGQDRPRLEGPVQDLGEWGWVSQLDRQARRGRS
jgi:hypothetical protein